jgi:DNA polymerase-3 subunit beta
VRLSIERDRLMNVLDTVLRAAPIKKSTLPVFECVLFEASAEKILIRTNTAELGAKFIESEVNVQEAGAVAINAAMFDDIVKAIGPGETIKIETESTNLKFETDEFLTTVRTLRAEDYPPFPDLGVSSQYFTVDQGDLKDAIQESEYAAAPEKINPNLACIVIELKDGVTRFCSAESVRLAVRRLTPKSHGEAFRVVIPVGQIGTIVRAMKKGKDIAVRVSGSRLVFDTGNLQVYTSTLAVPGLDFDRVIDSAPKDITIKVSRDELKSAMERATVIRDDTLKIPVTMSFDLEKIVIQCKSIYGDGRAELKAEATDKVTGLTFNGRMWIEALRRIQDEDITILAGVKSRMCLIVPNEGGSYTHLICGFIPRG